MLQSMTGFGKKEIFLNDKFYTIEIKSLNNKNTEINLKIPQTFKSIEFPLKTKLQQQLCRGSIECVVYQSPSNTNNLSFNIPLAKEYYQKIQSLCQELGIPPHNILENILRYPEISSSTQLSILEEGEIKKINVHLDEVIQQTIEFRKREGEILMHDILYRMSLLKQYKDNLLQHKNERIEGIKTNLENKLLQLQLKDKYDRDQFEQELIYYLEKMDFTEELVRLDAHCNYFIAVIQDGSEVMKGKKNGVYRSRNLTRN